MKDKPKNGVDENCDGKDADWRVNRARITNNWLAFPTYTLVDRLSLRGIPARGKATVKCNGDGCPFRKAKKLRVRNGKANATTLFKDDQLLPGAVIQITITAPTRWARSSGTRCAACSCLPGGSCVTRPASRSPVAAEPLDASSAVRRR